MLKLTFDLEYHGWLNILIENEAEVIEIPASFLSDSIGDLTSSLAAFAEGAKEVIVRFQTEPGEYRFRFFELGNLSGLEIFEFDDTFSTDELEKGKIILAYESRTRHDLIKNFYYQLLNLNDLGGAEYFRLWNHDFPKGALERLTRNMNILKKSKR
jgi:hypothetical protein